jgi:hypothetical protein
MEIIDKEIDDIKKYYASFKFNDNNSLDLMHKCPGEEHYILLSRFSALFDHQTILDVGTYKGLSALALSYNKLSTVISHDIKHNVIVDNMPENIELRICSDKTRIFNFDDFSKVKLILLDIDPHDGIQEQKYLDMLLSVRYNGYVLLDDIHLHSVMENFWNSIEVGGGITEKRDLTNVGHWSGTGLLCFG